MTSLGIALPPLTPGLLFAQIIVMLMYPLHHLGAHASE